MKEGAKVDFSTPLGEGFQIRKGFHSPTPDLAVNHVLLMACGSGLAPIAAAIESGCLQLGLKNLNDELQAPSALLYIGARSPAHLPYAEKYVEWEEKGVKVKLTVWWKCFNSFTDSTYLLTIRWCPCSAARRVDMCKKRFGRIPWLCRRGLWRFCVE